MGVDEIPIEITRHAHGDECAQMPNERELVTQNDHWEVVTICTSKIWMIDALDARSASW